MTRLLTMPRFALFATKLTLLIVVLILTNPGASERLHYLVVEKRHVTLIIYCVIWLVAFSAFIVAAFHPSFWVRLVWAVPMGVAGAAAYGYYVAQGSEFYVFDVLNFWSARHEAGRAAGFFSDAIAPTAGILVAGVLAIVMPPGALTATGLPMRATAALVPAIPIVLIALIILYREGKGSNALPKQFSPIAMSALVAYKLNTAAFPSRQAVHIRAGTPLARAVIMIVDESIRADFVSLAPNNPHTPQLAAQRARWIDFGPAGSAGNCSNISNAILRFMGDRRDLVGSVLRNPTVWQYAKAAGFRTVYIDAQAGFISVYGKLQNFMTLAETAWIDKLYKLGDGIPTHLLDDELVSLVTAELAVGDQVFIYANKNGAHFPYVDNAPAGQDHPHWSNFERPDVPVPESYGRAVAWSTDRPMARLTREANWSGSTFIYTSDHGQHFAASRLTHCNSVSNVDQHEGIVPLMVATGSAPLKVRFTKAAHALWGRTSHYAIPATLLELMGYAPGDTSRLYAESLLGDISAQPQFVSGDIFGLFGATPAWHDVDPMVQRRRPDAREKIGEMKPAQ